MRDLLILPKRGKVGTGEEQKKIYIYFGEKTIILKMEEKKKFDAKVCEY